MKKVTIMDLITKSVKQEVPAYDWQKQGVDLVKFGTGGSTGNAFNVKTDSWTD